MGRINKKRDLLLLKSFLNLAHFADPAGCRLASDTQTRLPCWNVNFYLHYILFGFYVNP